MLPKINSLKKITFAALILLLAAFALSGCQPAAPTSPDAEHEHTDESDHEHDEETGTARVPNEGAVIRLLSPADGETFAHGDDIVVEVAVENFDLSAEGNHWHLYVDGSTLNMVVGGNEKSVVHGLEPGEHEIEVYLGLPTHEELEEGAAVTITVTE
jgi:hypothetical protein